MVKINLQIEGMTCDSCSNSITKVVSTKNFVTTADVSWKEGLGKFEVDNEDRKQEIVNTIERLGYKVVN